MNRLMVPPLPAASRPSNTKTCRCSVGLAPLLQLQQFDLQQPLLLLVFAARHALVVRVVLPPGVHYFAAGLNDQLGIVVIVVAHGVAV